MSFQMSRAMSGSQDRDYAKALTDCSTLAELRELVTAYAPLALDAQPVVAAMTDADFTKFLKGLKSERRGKFAGDAWAQKFGAVLMPWPMMRVTQIADQFKVPFGVAWFRCKELRPDLLKVDVGAPSEAAER